MRTLSAALVSATAWLPALAHGTTTLPDPTDPAAPLPAFVVPSALAQYDAYRDPTAPDWRELNRAVTKVPPKNTGAGRNEHLSRHEGAAE